MRGVPAETSLSCGRTPYQSDLTDNSRHRDVPLEATVSINVPDPSARASPKIMALRRPDTCACGSALAAGEQAAWDRRSRTVWCLPCAQPMLVSAADTPPPTEQTPIVPAPIDLGVAGGSAQQEFNRRHNKRENRIRQAHPRLGGLILALTDDPQSTRAWQSGATGERKLAEKLASLGDSVIALHDRHVPKSRANIDHIVIGPAGVYVIDAKRYTNAKITVRRSGGFLNPARTQLMVAGRDKTKLIEAMDWQITAVRTALRDSAEFADVPITAALCFIDATFPPFGTININDVHVRGLGGMAKLISAAGPLEAPARTQLARHLAARLPAKPTSDSALL